MRFGNTAAGRVLRWLAFLGSPPGRRALPDMVDHHLSADTFRFFGSLFALLRDRAPATGRFRHPFIRIV